VVFENGVRKAVIEGEQLQFFYDGKEINRQSVPDMLSYSQYRPFELGKKEWSLAAQEEGADCLQQRWQSGSVEAKLVFRNQASYFTMELSFGNCGEETLVEFAGSLSLPFTGHGHNKVTIPHMIYNDNPSANPDKIVPHLGEIPGQGLIVEEHRLPIPAVNLEWEQEKTWYTFTLLSKPEVVTGEDKDYWSLGVVKAQDGDVVTALSGPLMFNGYFDSVYGGRCTPLSSQMGYRDLAPGDWISHTYYLDWSSCAVGKGFRSMVAMGYQVLKPETVSLHTPEEMIAYKKNVLDTRYCKKGDACGYKTFGDANDFGNMSGRPEYFLYGWTGQTLKLAWCDCVLGLQDGEGFRLERAMEIVDFFVRNGQSERKGLFYGYYMLELESWRGAWKNPEAGLASRIQGEAISDLLDILCLLREHGKKVPAHWEQAVQDACTFLMDEKNQTEDGIYPLAWELDGTIGDHTVNASGMPCVLALAKAYAYFGCEAYLAYAKKKYEIYYHLHMETFDVPFARATMDAKCEDKEAGLYFFEAAAEIYKITGDETYKQWAGIAADWILTFVFFWETGFAPKTVCREKGFRTTGWPGVSVQNHHLDVFFPSYELYAFGKKSGNAFYEEMGGHIRDALTYGVCTEKGEWGFTVLGEQGEHYYHTNYFQARYPSILKHTGKWRGGNNPWNPSWITAQVLSANLRFAGLDRAGAKENR
jgi:hypothetical protein